MGAIKILTLSLKSLEKWTEVKKHLFLNFDLNETLIFMSKFSMEACLEINYELVFQRKEV